MQKAHELSQPVWMVTHAAYGRSRAAPSAAACCSPAVSADAVGASVTSTTGPVSAALRSRAGALAALWVPKTTSTWGARARMASPSSWARHPPTAICMPGRRSRSALRLPRCPKNRLSAFSRMQQVLKTTTSAASSRSILTSPSARSAPARRSESCSFIWHPKVRIANVRGAGAVPGSPGAGLVVAIGPGYGRRRAGRAGYGWVASTTVWIPPRTSQSVVTVIRRGATAATRSSRMRLVTSSWNAPSFR